MYRPKILQDCFLGGCPVRPWEAAFAYGTSNFSIVKPALVSVAVAMVVPFIIYLL
jgi:hypothetical protein